MSRADHSTGAKETNINQKGAGHRQDIPRALRDIMKRNGLVCYPRSLIVIENQTKQKKKQTKK